MGNAIALGFAPGEGEDDEPDHEALKRLRELYGDRVWKLVRLRLGARLRKMVDSGDILEEAFRAAVRSLDSFEMREEASLINWLSRLVERQIIAAPDYHGEKKRDELRQPLPLEATASEEEQRIVEACLQELAEEYRELILLRNYAGASWETVAEETGLPSPAAARMAHARAMLELSKLVRARGAS